MLDVTFDNYPEIEYVTAHTFQVTIDPPCAELQVENFSWLDDDGISIGINLSEEYSLKGTN